MARRLFVFALLLILLCIGTASPIQAHSSWHWVGYDGCVAGQTNVWKYKSAYLMGVKRPSGSCSLGVCKVYQNIALMGITGAWAEVGVQWTSSSTTGRLYYRNSINPMYTIIATYSIPLNQQVRTEIWRDSVNGAVMAKWSWGSVSVSRVLTGFSGNICSASYVDIYNPSSTYHPSMDMRVDSIFPQEGSLQSVYPYSPFGGPWGFKVLN
jgi:hypothetical protein